MPSHRSVRRVVPVCALAALLVCGVPACSRSAPDVEANGVRNVVVIVVDTLAARHLGCHTPGLMTSPNIDRLASEGVQFTHAWANAPWTQPAVASLFTSLLPAEHGVQSLFGTLDTRFETLAEVLRKRGRRTFGASANVLVSRRVGFAQGFDEFDESAVRAEHADTAPDVTTAAKRLIGKAGGQPFLLYLHYFDPHWTYLHHPEFDMSSWYKGRLTPGMDIGKLRGMRDGLSEDDLAFLVSSYREAIAYTDHYIGELLAHLDEQGLADDTLVVFVGDHGEEFMEHGWIGHSVNVFETALHVPLIFLLPGRLQPRVVDVPVSLLDVLPTIEDLAGGATPGAVRMGRSLTPLLRGEPTTLADRDLIAELDYHPPADWPTGGPPMPRLQLTALRRGSLKLLHDIRTGEWEAFDLAADPAEVHSVLDVADPIQAAGMERVLTRERDR